MTATRMTAGRDNAFLPYPNHRIQTVHLSGPLSNLRLAVKDIFDVEGYPTGAGNAFLLAASGVKSQTAPIVQSLLDAGAEFIGKTYSDELAYAVTGLNPHFGSPRNPRFPEQLTGGSSSGSAVAVAEGRADIGMGSDTSGSIRLPAAMNGCIGWRPTHGLLPLTGCRPLAPSFDTVGFIVGAIDVLDRVMDACSIVASGPHEQQPVVVPKSLLDACDPGIADRFVRCLKQHRVDYELVDGLSVLDIEDVAYAFSVILWHEAWLSNEDLFGRRPDSIDPAIRERLALGQSITRSQLEKAREVRQRFRDDLDERFSADRIIAFPTLPVEPPSILASRKELDEFRRRVLAITCVAGLSGRPQLTLPAGHSVSVSMMTGRGGDRQLTTASRVLGVAAVPLPAP